MIFTGVEPSKIERLLAAAVAVFVTRRLVIGFEEREKKEKDVRVVARGMDAASCMPAHTRAGLLLKNTSMQQKSSTHFLKESEKRWVSSRHAIPASMFRAHVSIPIFSPPWSL